MTGWNTRADGTGTSFKLDDVVGVDNLVKDEGNTEANTYDLIDNTAVILTTAALKYVEEVLA